MINDFVFLKPAQAGFVHSEAAALAARRTAKFHYSPSKFN
jgi:hypothetical protein